MFIFNKNISFLRPRSVLSAVRPPFPFPLCFCDCPLLPHLESDGTVQPGLTSAAWTVPLWGFSGVGGEGSPGAETKALCCETIHQSSSRSVPSISILSRTKHQCELRHPTVWVCVGACRAFAHACRIISVREKGFKKSKHLGYRKTGNLLCCCYLLYRTHTHTHNCCSVPQCFPAPSNQHRPAVPQWAEPRWSQPVSVSVCIWILYFIISLQTASSLIILLTIILRMVSVS